MCFVSIFGCIFRDHITYSHFFTVCRCSWNVTPMSVGGLLHKIKYLSQNDTHYKSNVIAYHVLIVFTIQNWMVKDSFKSPKTWILLKICESILKRLTITGVLQRKKSQGLISAQGSLTNTDWKAALTYGYEYELCDSVWFMKVVTLNYMKIKNIYSQF